MKKYGDKIDATWLIKLLEEERDAGIPSIPERLRPEQIEAVLRSDKRREKKRHYTVVGGCVAMVSVFACFLMVFLPQNKTFKIDIEQKSAQIQDADSGMAGAANQETARSKEIDSSMQIENFQIKGTTENGMIGTEENALEENDTLEIAPEEQEKEGRRAVRPQGFPKEYGKK